MIFAGFDLDGTLVNTKDLIVRALVEKGHMPIIDGSFNFKFEKGTEPPADFQWDLFFYRLFVERWQEIEPIDGAYEFLREIYDGREVVRVSTARPDGALMHHACMQTLMANFPDIEFAVDVCGSGADKHKYLVGFPMYFDDRRQTVKRLSRIGFVVFMRNTEYNQIPTGSPYYEQVRAIEELSALSMHDAKAGSIITYDSFQQLIELGVPAFVSNKNY